MTLREFLKDNRITVTDFAKKLGCSRSYLSRVIWGDIKPGKMLAKVIELETKGKVTPKDFDVPQVYFDIHSEDGKSV